MWCRRRAERPATPTEPQQWQMHPPSETVAISRWPKIPNFVSARPCDAARAALSDLDGATADLGAPQRAARTRRSAAAAAPWPQHRRLPPLSTVAPLPVPAAEPFKIRGIGAPDTAGAPPSRRADSGAGPRNGSLVGKVAGKPGRQAGRPQPNLRRAAGHGEPTPQSAARPPPSRRRQPDGMGASLHVAGLEEALIGRSDRSVQIVNRSCVVRFPEPQSSQFSSSRSWRCRAGERWRGTASRYRT